MDQYAISSSALRSIKPASKKQGWNAKSQSNSRDKSIFAVGETDPAQHPDGTHYFDETCTELMISERDLLNRFRDWGDVQTKHR